MKRIVMISLLVLLMGGLFAANQAVPLARPHETARNSMETANLLYESEQFAEAAQAYQQLVDSGIYSSSLFYNLGNAYFRLGDHGRAILNYRRAQELDAKDRDVQANLTLARAASGVGAAATPDVSPWTSLLLAMKGWLTLNEVAMIAVGLWMLSLLFLVGWLSFGRNAVQRGFLKTAWVASAILLASAVLALGGYHRTESVRSGAVVIAEEAAVWTGPGTQYVSELELQAGAELELVETRGNWSRVKLAGADLDGWVPAGDVEALWE